MENHNVKDDERKINQAITALEEQLQEESNVLDNLDQLERELTEQETRRENTATDRCAVYSNELILLGDLCSALVKSDVALVRDSTEEKIQSLKAALTVEEACRDQLDRIPTLTPGAERRRRTTVSRCATIVARISGLRKLQIAKQDKAAAVLPTEGGGQAAATTCTFADLTAKVLPSTPILVESPTRSGGDALLRSSLASFSLEGPVFLKPVLDDDSVGDMKSLELSYNELLQEGAFYELVGATIPSWVSLLGKRSRLNGGVSAGILYGANGPGPSFRRVSWPWQCLLEQTTRSDALHAGFNAEVKSVAGKQMWNELLTYVAMSIVDALFRRSSDIRFYTNPPVGYGVVCFPHCGYIVAVEWVGKLLATPYSQPFFVGSKEHKVAVAGLPDVDFHEFIGVNMENIKWHSMSNRLVCWTGLPTVLTADNGQQLVNQFLKLMTCESFDHLHEPAGFFRRLYNTYKTYGAAWDAESASPTVGAVPQALLRARLWCGVFAVVVTMDFIKGNEATEKQLQASTPNDEKGARGIATAVVWLARRGLIYYDLREPNILVESDGCWRLIDYDDMIMVEPGSVNTVADMEKVLEAEQRLQRLRGVVAAFKCFPKLLQFIDDAFLAD